MNTEAGTDQVTTAADAAHDAWARVLHAYSATLDEQRTNLAALAAGIGGESGPIACPTFVPPAGMPPLPADLRRRADQLLEETAGLVQVAAELSARDRPPAPTRTSRPVAPRPATSRPAALDALL